MNPIKKKVLVLALLFVLVSFASATDLSFATFFPECPDNITSSFDSSVRCGAYFFVPNLHFEAGWNLLLNGITGAVQNIGSVILGKITDVSMADKDLQSVGLLDYIITAFSRLVLALFILSGGGVLYAIPVFVYGVASSVIAYICLLTFDFVKTYLFVSVGWLLWRDVLFDDSSLEWNYQGRVLVVAALMVVGSIVLLAMDFTVWGW